MGEPEKKEHREESKEEKIDIFRRFFYVFLCILYIVLSTSVFFQIKDYVIEKFDKIIELPLAKFLDEGIKYVQNFNYYNVFFYTIVLAIILLGLYLTIVFVLSEKSIYWKEYMIFILLIFFLFLSIYYKNNLNFENKKFFIVIFAILFVIKINLDEKFINKGLCIKESLFFLILIIICSFPLFIRSYEFISHYFSFGYFFLFFIIPIMVYSITKDLIKKERKNILKWRKNTPFELKIFIFSSFSYWVACFLFGGALSSVVNFPIIISLISGSFFIYGLAIEHIFVLSREIITSILNTKTFTTVEWIKKIEELIGKLRSQINSLLINFLTAISSYLFITAFFKIFSNEKLPSFMNSLNVNLSLILLIPLYLFFYRGGSEIIRSFCEEMYNWIENTLSVSESKLRKDSFIKVFDRLVKIGIAIFIIFNILNQSTKFQSWITSLSNSNIEYIIQIAIAAPIVMWVLVLVLDPFFEMETIEVGTNTGKIRNVGFLFTKLETLTGEHIYIPNAELLARTIKRLNARGSYKKVVPPKKDQIQDQKEISSQKKDNIKYEKGIIINFQCTLNYSHELCIIRRIFDELFEDKNKIPSLNEYFNKAGFDLSKERIEDILSEPCQFVSIEEFKDHGVVYRFNFRVKDSFHAPIFRSYFMSKFKEKMETEIITPSKIEISTVYEGKFT